MGKRAEGIAGAQARAPSRQQAVNPALALNASGWELYSKGMASSSSNPTIRSLASEAGVSPMTVSLALRQSSEVSAATRQRILKLARTRGYRPDPQITKLMT